MMSRFSALDLQSLCIQYNSDNPNKFYKISEEKQIHVNLKMFHEEKSSAVLAL